MAITDVAAVVVPEIFTPYIQQLTEEKARLVQSGVLARNSVIDGLLDGGGRTFNVPSFQDLSNDDDNISGDQQADIQALSQLAPAAAIPALFDSIPLATATSTEIAVRLSRNQSWSSADLATALAGADPMASIASRVAYYWQRRLQAAFIATWQGVSKNNGVDDAGDYANDISGSSFTDGVTNFSAEAFLDAAVTMGDSQENLTAVMVHSVVFNRMQKNNLIDFIPDSRGEINIPMFLGREVIVDDGVPSGTNVVLEDGDPGSAGMYETWLFGPGAMQWGVSSPKVATEVTREAAAGNGGGQEILHSRQEWSLHPVGHAFIGSSGDGGPSNAASSTNLNFTTSWDRRYPERKQIGFARLITREA